jgi:hypothetical protein
MVRTIGIASVSQNIAPTQQYRDCLELIDANISRMRDEVRTGLDAIHSCITKIDSCPIVRRLALMLFVCKASPIYVSKKFWGPAIRSAGSQTKGEGANGRKSDHQAKLISCKYLNDCAPKVSVAAPHYRNP